MYIALGSKVRDTVTGLTGIATCRCEYLNGCVRYAVQPSVDKDGKYIDSYWIDEGQIKVLKEPAVLRKSGKATGGPGDEPAAWSVPR